MPSSPGEEEGGRKREREEETKELQMNKYM
jgi:hypothetical protein